MIAVRRVSNTTLFVVEKYDKALVLLEGGNDFNLQLLSMYAVIATAHMKKA